jgi:hypothetical protein
VYVKRGNLGEAIRNCERAIELDPHNGLHTFASSTHSRRQPAPQKRVQLTAVLLSAVPRMRRFVTCRPSSDQAILSH